MKITKFIFSAAVLITAASFTFGQKVPTFGRYSTKVETVKNIKVNFASHKNARMYRTNLRNAAKEGVNFAGHFVLTGWGCGTNCSVLAIIDARNGKVFFPKELEGVGSGFCELPEGPVTTDAPAENEYWAQTYFKNDSRLLVIQGFKAGDLNNSRSKCGNYYWEWTGTALRQVGFKPGKRTDAP